MFNKILFATTASPVCDNAAKVAFDLEAKWEATLYVFHVFGVPTRGFRQFAADVRTGERVCNDDEYVMWVIEEMKNTYARQLDTGKNIVLEATAGVPHVEILRKSRRENVDLIIMGAHTREEDVGAARFKGVVGSTMQRVAKFAECPVVIISRPCTTCWKLFSNIVFSTDFSGASDSAFLFGYKLARNIGAKFHLFHAVDPPNGGDPGRRPSGAANTLKEIREKIHASYVSRMDGFDNYEVGVSEGIPYVEILRFAREKQADLIVMAHHTREGDPQKALLGSTVEQVVLRATRPVMSVNRPDKVVDM